MRERRMKRNVLYLKVGGTSAVARNRGSRASRGLFACSGARRGGARVIGTAFNITGARAEI
jgi:hypothetical protein